MNFDQWMKRPVYVAQCRTFKRAQELLGMTPPGPQRGLATPGDHVLVTFRALRQYRTTSAQALRDRVARSVRAERRAHA